MARHSRVIVSGGWRVRKSELGRKDSTKVQYWWFGWWCFCISGTATPGQHQSAIPFPFHSISIPLPWRILTTSLTIPIGSALDQQHSQWHLCAAGAGLMTQLCNSQWHNCAAGVRRRALQNCTCAAAARHQHCHGFAAHTNMARVRHGCSFQGMGNHEHSSMAKLVAFLGTFAGCLAAAALLKTHLPEPKQQSQQRADWDDGEGHSVGSLGMAGCSCCCGGMDLWQAVL